MAKTLFPFFVLFLLPLSASNSHAVKVGDVVPMPHQGDGPLEIKGEYKSGFLEIRIINPSHPDVETNSYIYIPTKYQDIENIEVALGPGIEQTGKSKLYPDWIADAFERGVNEIMANIKIVELAVIIGSPDLVIAAVMTAETSRAGEIEVILKVYKNSRDNLRAAAMNHFITIISTINKPDQQLPIDRGKPHWLLPPSSSLIIKIPAKVKSDKPSYTVFVREYRVLNTGKQASLGEFTRMKKLASDANEINLGRSPGLDFPEFQYKSAQLVEEQTQAVVLNEVSKEMPHDLFSAITNFFNDVVRTITIHLGWEGSNLDLKVIDPEGNIYYGYEAGDNTEGITINDAMPGEWKIEVINRDVPPEGETYTISVIENEGQLDVLDFEIIKSLKEIRRRRHPLLNDVFGIMEVKVRPKSMDMAYIEINDSLGGSRASYVQVYLVNGEKEISLSRSDYYLSQGNDKIFIAIDFNKGIFTEEFPTILRETKEKQKECFNRRMDPPAIRECIAQAKEDTFRKNKAFSLKDNLHILVRYYSYIKFNPKEITTETKAKAVSSDGLTLTKGKLTKFVP